MVLLGMSVTHLFANVIRYSRQLFVTSHFYDTHTDLSFYHYGDFSACSVLYIA